MCSDKFGLAPNPIPSNHKGLEIHYSLELGGLIITWILTVVPFTVEGLGVPPAEALIMGEVHFGFPKIRTFL